MSDAGHADTTQQDQDAPAPPLSDATREARRRRALRAAAAAEAGYILSMRA